MTIPIREDGYINITVLCKANNKLYSNWKKSQQAEEQIHALEHVLRIGRTELIQSITGGNSKLQGTYVHRRLGLLIASWISPYFAIQVASWIEELLITGQVTLGKELSTKELEYQNKLQTLSTSLTTSQQDYEKLRQCHNSIKFKRNYYELETGYCVYKNNYLKISYL